MTKPQSPYDPELAPKNLEHIKYREEGPCRIRDDQSTRSAQCAA